MHPRPPAYGVRNVIILYTCAALTYHLLRLIRLCISNILDARSSAANTCRPPKFNNYKSSTITRQSPTPPPPSKVSRKLLLRHGNYLRAMLHSTIIPRQLLWHTLLQMCTNTFSSSSSSSSTSLEHSAVTQRD